MGTPYCDKVLVFLLDCVFSGSRVHSVYLEEGVRRFRATSSRAFALYKHAQEQECCLKSQCIADENKFVLDLNYRSMQRSEVLKATKDQIKRKTTSLND